MPTFILTFYASVPRITLHMDCSYSRILCYCLAILLGYLSCERSSEQKDPGVYEAASIERPSFIGPLEINTDDKDPHTVPAVISVATAGVPDQIHVEGLRKEALNVSRIIDINPANLKVIEPGVHGIPEPLEFRLPDDTVVNALEFPLRIAFFAHDQDTLFAPASVNAIHPEPRLTSPLHMKQNAIGNIQLLGTDQGLPNPVVNDILPDSKGNLWFGLNGGVCRYDGTFLTSYTESEGLFSDNNPLKLSEDSRGNLWISLGWGLVRYDGTRFSLFFFTGGVSASIHTHHESEDGHLWFGTKRGLMELDGKILKFYKKEHGLSDNSINAFAADRSGNFWLGTKNGLTKFDGHTFTRYTVEDGLIHPSVQTIIEDNRGDIWIGTEGGLCRFDGKRFSQFEESPIKDKVIHSLFQDSGGAIWIGTRKDGVYLFDGDFLTHYTTKVGLSHNSIHSICEDRAGNIWLGTEKGATRIRKNSFSYIPGLESGGQGRVKAICEDQEKNLWLGIWGEGLIRYDGNSFASFSKNQGLYNEDILDIQATKNGELWFSTKQGGLQLLSEGSLSLFKEPEIIRNEYSNKNMNNILLDDKGMLWLGTRGDGLKHFNGRSFRGMEYSSRKDQWVNGLAMRNGIEIWVTKIDKKGGLFQYDGSRIRRWNLPVGSMTNELTMLYTDSRRDLWIGTKNAGAFRYNGKTFKSFTKEDGLSSNHITSIIEDHRGNIWMGTASGLNLLTNLEDGTYSIYKYQKEAGLKELFFNPKAVCLDHRNRLWWGTNDVITRLDLNTFLPNPVKPEIHLNNLRIGQEHASFNLRTDHTTLPGIAHSGLLPFYNIPTNLNLKHNRNHLGFHFSAIDWSAPQQLSYTYKLEGLDNDWSHLNKENSVEYRNLRPGHYTFQVKAIGQAGIWSETLDYSFRIHRPWWAAWWSFSLYGIAFIILLRFFIRFTLSKERVKAEVRIKQLEMDKMRELDHMKNRFFANISHEFKTPLTLLLGPIDDLLRKGDRSASERKRLFILMKRNGLRLQQLISQLLDLSTLESKQGTLRVSKGKLHVFLRTLISSFQSFAADRKIRLDYELMESSRVQYFDRDKLSKILSNLITNALKFTPEGGKVNIRLYYEDGAVPELEQYAKIEVKDTGVGIPEESLEQVFNRFYQVKQGNLKGDSGSGIGLALTKELVELYRGEITLKSKPGIGSTFTVRLPVSIKLFREDEIDVDQDRSKEEKRSVGAPQTSFNLEELVSIGNQMAETIETVGEKPAIVVVEDNQDLRTYIRQILEDGYDILTAEHGKAGFQLALEAIPDLVISDLMMPEMDGIELCNKLKKDHRTSHIPLIMLTAKADKDSRLDSLKTGADDFITKPFDAVELRTRVSNLISMRKKLREKYRKEFLLDKADEEAPVPRDYFLEQVMASIDTHLADSDFGVNRLCLEVGLSRTQLYRKLIALTDQSPSELIRNCRLKAAARLFREGHSNVSRVLYSVGFNSSSHFASQFRELYGLNPKEFIRQHLHSPQ